MSAGACKSQNENVFLHGVEKEPVIFDVAIAIPEHVSDQCVVLVLRRKCVFGLWLYARSMLKSSFFRNC